MSFLKIKGSKPRKKLSSPTKEGRGRIILNCDYITSALSWTGEEAAASKEDTESLLSTEQTGEVCPFETGFQIVRSCLQLQSCILTNASVALTLETRGAI